MHLHLKLQIYTSAVMTQWITNEFTDAPYKACTYVFSSHKGLPGWFMDTCNTWQCTADDRDESLRKEHHRLRGSYTYG